jgi:hypothetical protein
MAQSKDNIITHGLSGKLGNILVFSQRHGKTIVSKVPKHNPEQSAKQKEQVAKFQEAVIYAKTAIKDANTKAAYAARHKKVNQPIMLP